MDVEKIWVKMLDINVENSLKTFPNMLNFAVVKRILRPQESFMYMFFVISK